MSYDLQVLAKPEIRDALFLAEVAAWLHDWEKCTDEHVNNQARPGTFASKKRVQFAALGVGGHTVNLLGEALAFDQLTNRQNGSSLLVEYLNRCHRAPHIEKEEPANNTERDLFNQLGKQPALDTRPSSPFGYEGDPLTGLTTALMTLPFGNLTDRQRFASALRQVFSQALGDTRRPENEVTLWDWSTLVAALYKATLAGALLGGHQPAPNDLRWQFLSIRVNEAGFGERVARIPDLLARQELLTDAFEQVRVLLEETYPLGTLAYQDETNALYVAPNLPDLLDTANAGGATLRALVLHKFAIGTIRNVKDPERVALLGEIIPSIELDTSAWWGQRPDFRNQPATLDELPPVAEILRTPAERLADVQFVAEAWSNTASDVCPVCGLRPQAAPDTKAGRRNVCVVCERRRANRAEAWTQNLHTTIWTDEVADVNGRLALIVGQFDLSKWLDGSMVQTLTVTEPQNGQAVLKNPSFARLRRVWEATRMFWQSALDERDANGAPTISPVSARLEIIPQNRERLDLGKFHTYELVVNNIHVSIVWDSDNKRFITCDNLDYLAKPEQLGKRLEDIVVKGKTFTLEEPAGYGAKNKVWGTLTVDDVKSLNVPYTPAIPILAEPRTFMALVPANRALGVVKAIEEKYEREMSKVRNRLPLTLGAVYFGRRTPLATALDAGRRMLKAPVTGGEWHVSRDVGKHKGNAPDHLRVSKHFDEWVEVPLRNSDREITVRVSVVMGDGTTEDKWYPYWRVENKPKDGTRWFVGPDGEHWVHVSDLRGGDRVTFTPSTFDFEFLDTTARRFEVSYENGQRRGKDKRQRPYLLEQVDELEEVWGLIKPKKQADKESALSTTQIKALEALIRARREWLEHANGQDSTNAQETFRQFCHDALATAGWRGKPWNKFSDTEKQLLERAAVSGMLADALELHLTIAKEKEE